MSSDRFFTLDNNVASTYLKSLATLLRSARLSTSFPSVKSQQGLYQLLDPKSYPTIHHGLKLDIYSGLPAGPEITKVIADKAHAHKFLASIQPQSLHDKESQAVQKVLAKIDYYEKVIDTKVPELFQTQIKLRKLDQNSGQAYLLGIYDCWDPVTAMFVRYTIKFRQHGVGDRSNFNSKGLTIDESQVQTTTSLRTMLSRYAAVGTEIAFILLDKEENINVEEVTRCQIGPLWSRWCPPVQSLQPLYEKHPEAYILNLPLERTTASSNRISAKEDNNRDPFSLMLSQQLSELGQEIFTQEQHELNYTVYKERKFSCSNSILSELRSTLSQAGYPCICYGAQTI